MPKSGAARRRLQKKREQEKHKSHKGAQKKLSPVFLPKAYEDLVKLVKKDVAIRWPPFVGQDCSKFKI